MGKGSRQCVSAPLFCLCMVLFFCLLRPISLELHRSAHRLFSLTPFLSVYGSFFLSIGAHFPRVTPVRPHAFLAHPLFLSVTAMYFVFLPLIVSQRYPLLLVALVGTDQLALWVETEMRPVQGELEFYALWPVALLLQAKTNHRRSCSHS